MSSRCHSLFHDFPNKGKIIQRISEMLLTRNNVKDRDQRIANDISHQLTIDLQEAVCYSVRLDESRDVNNHARLAVFLRSVAGDVMKEELLKLCSLPKKNTRHRNSQCCDEGFFVK